MEVRPGQAVPGATWDGQGTNFAVSAGSAQALDLCLFDAEGDGGSERRVALWERTGPLWHGWVEGVGPGQRYGFRASGPYAPSMGNRFNPAKLLLDPYARAISGRVEWHPSLFDDDTAGPRPEDTAPFVPRSVVVDTAFDWGDDRSPRTPWADTVLYELHLKGFTAAHPDVPRALRGTYAGMAHPAVLEYLSALGVTAVELLPVHQFVSEPVVARRGLTNYWGYSTIGFFAPHGAYAAAGDGGAQVDEFKAMVKALHAVGIEVILDVVYNHTAEGDRHGPTLCHRGLDNAAYYRLAPEDRSRYVDHTGTGNTLDTRHPTTLRLILDSLRYWAGEMHVDGFRFDLASALARGDHGFDPHCAFLSAVGQDPVLAQVKLIAEPWDATAAGYQAGRFPAGWSEWNDCFRNGVRDFWRGRAWSPAEMGFRLTGSSDLYQRDHRRPQASVNFVTAHDGFTLRDLVSYDRKHNRANGEDGRDGSDDNRSWNCGAEGETADPAIGELRRRQQRNFLATLLLSQGVPMLLAGDEMNRTQRGNNNAYCHDGPLGWVDWDLDEAASELCELTRALVYLRRHSSLLRREQFLNGGSRPEGAPPGPTDLPDVAWLTPEGTPMGEREWSAPGSTAFTMVLNGPDETLAVLFNASNGPVKMVLPGRAGAGSDAVEILVDTAGRLDGTVHGGGGRVELESRSLVVGRVRPRPG